MSLATRCTACGTIFRVVQDQLRVSEGWVRCGRCAEVFDARDQLFDIDHETPPLWPTEAAAASKMSDEHVLATPPGQTVEPDDIWRQRVPMTPEPPPEDDLLANSLKVTARQDLRLEPQWMEGNGGQVATFGRLTADARTEPDANQPMLPNDLRPDLIFSPTRFDSARRGNAPLAAPSTADAGLELPSFMRSSAEAVRWRSTAARSALAGGLVLALCLLGWQLFLHFRDAIAAVYPQSRPALLSLCRIIECNLHPWQRIDAVSVENSALTQARPYAPGAPGGSTAAANQYLLSVNLHNKSGVDVATPAVELSLLDAGGRVSLRRVLTPGDFRTDKAGLVASPPVIAAGSDLPLRALLSTGDQRISGYSVEIFHP